MLAAVEVRLAALDARRTWSDCPAKVGAAALARPASAASWAEVAVARVQRLEVHVVGDGDPAHPPRQRRLADRLHRRLAVAGEFSVDVLIR
jgi:hypothetical protein